MKIEPMKVDDLPTILEIEKESYKNPWEEKDYLYELKENPFAYYFKLVHDDKIIGYIGFWITFEIAQVTKVTIVKEFRGKKLSYILLKDMEERIKQATDCNQITLEVRVSNEVAIHIYEKFGFEIATVRKDYYSDHEDAYLMVKEVIA